MIEHVRPAMAWPCAFAGRAGPGCGQRSVWRFLLSGTASAAQIRFINMVVEHLTDQGTMDPALLYRPPFTDIAATGPDDLFGDERVTRLFSKVEAINASAVA